MYPAKPGITPVAHNRVPRRASRSRRQSIERENSMYVISLSKPQIRNLTYSAACNYAVFSEYAGVNTTDFTV